MSFNTVGSPGSASYSGAGPINWAQLLNPQQPAAQQQSQNQNSLGAAIMKWLQQQQQQAGATTPAPVNVASNFNPNTSGGAVY